MSRDPREILEQCFRAILRPAARFALRHSVPFKTVLESVKIALVELAAEELEQRGEKVNVSRLAVATGLYRRDISRIYREGDVRDPAPHFIGKIIDRWQRDRRFLSASGNPRVLSHEGDGCEFYRLVRAVTVDVHPRAVLVEMYHLGAIEETTHGVKLKSWGYIPRRNLDQGLKFLGLDSEDLINSITENLLSKDKKTPHFQMVSAYDNLPKDQVPKIERWLHKECRKFQKRVAKYLSCFDLDLHPDEKREGGSRVALGVFTHTKK